MRNNALLFLMTVLFGCQQTEPTFLTSTRSYSGKLYFFSKENHLDISRNVFVLCVGKDSALVYSRFEIVAFDSIDYFYLDTSYEPNHLPDSALAFADQRMQDCLGGIAVQLSEDFTVVSRRKLDHQEIVKDSRLSSYKPDCEEMDEAELYELKTAHGEIYHLYDLNLYRLCDYLSSNILLFHGNELINRQKSY